MALERNPSNGAETIQLHALNMLVIGMRLSMDRDSWR